MNDRSIIIVAFSGLAAAGALWWLRQSQGQTDNGTSGNPFSVVDAVIADVQAAWEEAAVKLDDTLSSLTRWDIPAAGEPYRAAIYAAEDRNGIPRLLLARLLYQESRFRQDIITGQKRSPVGALGIAQFMPATAADLGIDPLNPTQAIDAAGRYLAQLYRRFGDWSLALGAYNWGQGNVANKGIRAAPAETVAYIREITADVQIA